MTDWIKYGHVLVKVLLVTLVLSLVWTFWPLIMALLGLVGAYYLVAIVLRKTGIQTEINTQLKEKRR